MYFYTHPFEIPGTEGKGSTILELRCEVFTLWDDLTKKNQSVIHYSMEEAIKVRGSDDDVKDLKLFVNRTELNK